MRILFLLLFFMVGCVEQPSTQSVGTNTLADQRAFATLATTPMELEAAPAYTKLALFRSLAARDLRAGRISVETAKSVQSDADVLRANLDASLRNKDSHGISNTMAEINAVMADYEANK